MKLGVIDHHGSAWARLTESCARGKSAPNSGPCLYQRAVEQSSRLRSRRCCTSHIEAATWYFARVTSHPISSDVLEQLELMPVKPAYRAAFQAVLELARSTMQAGRGSERGERRTNQRGTRRWEPMARGLYGADLRLEPLYVGVYAYEGMMSLDVSLKKSIRRAPAVPMANPEDHASLIPEAKRQALELAKTVLRDALLALDHVEDR